VTRRWEYGVEVDEPTWRSLDPDRRAILHLLGGVVWLRLPEPTRQLPTEPGTFIVAGGDVYWRSYGDDDASWLRLPQDGMQEYELIADMPVDWQLATVVAADHWQAAAIEFAQWAAAAFPHGSDMERRASAVLRLVMP
jgi:hypothetical protein